MFEDRLELFGGRHGLLVAAREWLSTCSGQPSDLEARVLFGVSYGKVEQQRRALMTFEIVQEVLWGRGIVISPARYEVILNNIWSTLMTAGTVTVVDAAYVCIHDPIEQVLCRLAGTPAKTCRHRIVEEQRARAAGRRPTRYSLWGRLNGAPPLRTTPSRMNFLPQFRRPLHPHPENTNIGGTGNTATAAVTKETS
jgi:hypothetical protein